MKVSPRWFWLALVFLTTQLVYLHTLNPAFPNDDSAETITAGVTLGLQHPPGYALAAIVGRCESFIPLGGFGFRANWGGSLLGSLGAVLLTFLLFSLLKSGWFLGTDAEGNWVVPFGAVMGGLSLGFSPTYWQNALSAKGGIYLLTICLQLMILAYLIYAAKNDDKTKAKVLGLSFFLAGLGLANHWETLVIFIPAILLFFYLTKNRKLLEWIQAVSFSFLGASALLYLPLRAHRNPVLNLGAPDTFSSFLTDLFRHYYSYRETNLWSVWISYLKGSSSWNQFILVFHQIIKNKGEALFLNLGWDIGWFTFGLALLGVALWFRSPGKNILSFILLSWFLLWSSIFFYYNSSQTQNTPLLEIKFFLSSDWMIFLLASLALTFLLSKINHWKNIGSVLAAALIVGYLTVHAKQDLILMDQQRQVDVYDYGQNLLKSLPSHSLFFAESDEDYFSLYYLQQVEHRRPDVIMIPTFTLFEPWGTQKVERKNPDLGLTASTVSFPDHFARIIYAASELAVKNRKQRPVAFSNFNGAFHRYYLDQQKNIKIRSSGLVWILESPIIHKGFCLSSDQLRIREIQEFQNQWDGSLEGIRKVYKSVGIDL